MVEMLRAKTLSLGAIVAVSILVVPVATASARISFHWVVAGNLLSASEHRTFDINNDGKPFHLHMDLGALSVLLLSGAVLVVPGAKIVGGIPSATEDTILFRNVTVDTPANCTISQGSTTGIIKTVSLKTEIVESAPGGTGSGEVDLLFAPKEGDEFANFELLGTTCVGEGEVRMEGDLLGLPTPNRTEVLRQDVKFEAVTKEYLNSLGDAEKAGLSLGALPATVNGLVLMLLTSDELFGPF
jgi:hypothetical protein